MNTPPNLPPIIPCFYGGECNFTFVAGEKRMREHSPKVRYYQCPMKFPLIGKLVGKILELLGKAIKLHCSKNSKSFDLYLNRKDCIEYIKDMKAFFEREKEVFYLEELNTMDIEKQTSKIMRRCIEMYLYHTPIWNGNWKIKKPV